MSEQKQTNLVGLYAALRAPLPDEAMKADSSRGFLLIGIKGAYVFERLNEVFGLCGMGWRFQIGELKVEDGWATCGLSLSYRVNGEWSEPIPAMGASNVVKGRAGDAMKGAITDALKKAGSYVGVGELAYKGLLAPPTGKQPATPRKNSSSKHWIDDDRARKRFWAWAKGTLKLTEAQIHEALGVEHMRDFPGTMQEAKERLETFVLPKEGA